MLTIEGLTKTYPGEVRALKDVSLDVPPGMFGLLGPNGAGKTTLMKILATLLEPDRGSGTMPITVDAVAEDRVVASTRVVLKPGETTMGSLRCAVAPGSLVLDRSFDVLDADRTNNSRTLAR